MSFQIGDTLGDYQIIGVLGAGGMGKVYKVKNLISDRIDALKILLPNLADDPDLADRFIREIKVLASLNHPNIAGLRTAFRLENQLLMVMEFVDGTTLDERTKAGRILLPDAINYIMQALSALGYAHKHGVIHRDIKPANMMLTPDNVVKLMDFGIAKSKSDKKLTQTGTTMGSLFYMSAEQVQGNELDGRSDLYSVGVSLYELVTGSRPFQGKSDFDIMVAQLQQAPQPPIQMMPDLPRALNDIIMISLEKDPNKRFQTAEAFAAALGSITSSLNATPAQASASGTCVPVLPPSPTGTQPFGTVPPTYNPPPAPASATGLLSAQTAPGPSSPPPAIGGTMPSGGGYVSSSNMPTVMAPEPAAPAPPTIPLPDPSHGVPAATGSRGYRGLYMTLGALIVVAVLVVAAIQVPRFLKTRASNNQTSQAVASNSTNPAPAPPTPVSDAVAPEGGGANSSAVSNSLTPDTGQAGAALGAGNPASRPVDSGASISGAASNPSSMKPGGSQASNSNKTPKAHNSTSNMAAGGGQNLSVPAGGGGRVEATSQAAAPGQVSQAAPGNNPADAQAIEELTDLHEKLTIRAQAVNDGVENLRKQMAATGDNLRADIGASQSRMKLYMGKFESALNAGDPTAARTYMGKAEHEVEALEKYLGH